MTLAVPVFPRLVFRNKIGPLTFTILLSGEAGIAMRTFIFPDREAVFSKLRHKITRIQAVMQLREDCLPRPQVARRKCDSSSLPKKKSQRACAEMLLRMHDVGRSQQEAGPSSK